MSSPALLLKHMGGVTTASAKTEQKRFSAIFTSCAAGLALSAQGILLIARLAKFMFAFAFVRGGTRGKLAAWDERQEELMTWFKVCVCGCGGGYV